MSYTSPTITPSSSTLANLTSSGFTGQIEKLISTNTFTQEQQNLLRTIRNRQFDRVLDRASVSISNLTSGLDIPAAVIAQQLLDVIVVFKSTLAVLEEIAVISANATRTTVVSTNATGTQSTTSIVLS